MKQTNDGKLLDYEPKSFNRNIAIKSAQENKERALTLFERFWKQVYFSLSQNTSKNWCWKCKMSCTFLQMLVILRKMTAGPCKMTATPPIMLAATHLMFAKDQRGGLRSPQGTPPTPLLEKTLLSRNDF